jgi:CubicO group peptidase (beta-lactamase class C family)
MFKSLFGALTVAFGIAAIASAQVPSAPKPARIAISATPELVQAGDAPTLTKQDVDAWLDGFMPYALASNDIAGAVVVVVKDGQVLTERGFGFADVQSRRPVDPRTTLFRPGSVSKLFTWTAVMQLVEAGKINLDTDVNQYLDFKIPPYDGKPVTMRELMTHTAGFAETIKHLFPSTAARVLPLNKMVGGWIPNRIFPPGETPAYSNYGAALAGYIVQRVSGEPFDQYIEQHIFAPLGMNHSSFRQPLPPALLRSMSSGYLRASTGARPYEFVGPAPAGSLAATGDDMSHFMIAQLNNGQYGGARILQDATAREMHAPQVQHTPPLDGMALGFYHEDQNGQVIVGHAGDTVSFHSDLHLLLNDDVGLFISMNSRGKDGAAQLVRSALFADFMDRYYPAPTPTLPTMASAKADAATMKGQYWASRRVDSGFVRLLNLLGQTKIVANRDGTVVVAAFTDAAGAPLVWREIGPFIWKDPSGKHTMVAVVKNGRVLRIGEDFPAAFEVYQPAPFADDARWNIPLMIAMAAIMAVALLMWPVQVLVRRRYGRTFPLSGRRALLYRITRATALIDLVVLAVYFSVVQAAGSNISLFDDPLDIWLRMLQVLCVLGVIGAALSVWNLLLVWARNGESWWAKTSVTLLTIALLAFVWFVISLQFVTPTLNY